VEKNPLKSLSEDEIKHDPGIESGTQRTAYDDEN